MTATNITRTVGIENGTIKVGNGLTLRSDAISSTKAEDIVKGPGDASAVAGTTDQASVLNSTITVGDGAVLFGNESTPATPTNTPNLVEARARTTTGSASATAFNGGATGGFLDTKGVADDIKIGKDGTVQALVLNDAVASADAVGGASTASADAGRVDGFSNVGVVTGLGTRLDANVQSTSTANATSVGLPPSPGTGNASAYAGGGSSRSTGYYGSGAAPLSLSFGDGGVVDARSLGNRLSATANTVNGAAIAASTNDLVAGIVNDQSSTTTPSPSTPTANGLSISIGRGGSVRGWGEVDATANAGTTTGPATAVVSVDTTGGIIDRRQIGSTPTGLSTLSFGTTGSVDALALASANAIASGVTTPEPGDVIARTNLSNVVGVALNKLKIGTEGSLYAGASSTQNAQASSVRAGADPLASAAHGDLVAGFTNTAVSVGTNLIDAVTVPLAEAYLSATANATGVSSTAPTSADAGVGSSVLGLDRSSVAVGQSVLTGTGARGTLRALADAGLNATATVTTGNAYAQAGGSSEVAAISSSPIAIGKSGNVSGEASGSVAANATATTGNTWANADQLARGIRESNVAIGENGTVNGSAVLTGTATSKTQTGNASASTALDAVGIDQLTTLIKIGIDGGVNGSGTAQLGRDGVLASAVSGDTTARGALMARGLDLAPASAITIGNSGNVAGTASGGVAAVKATGVSGDAAAFGTFDLAGIMGQGSSSIVAGPKGGNITGQVGTALVPGSQGLVTADATTGNTTTSTVADLYGIKAINLEAGLIGTNTISALANGKYTTTSTSVTGNADAHGDVSVGGLIGSGNTAKLSGNVSGTALLSNTVTASTVSGSATATASGDAVGIGGYSIEIIGSGAITAVANSTTVASASTVSV